MLSVMQIFKIILGIVLSAFVLIIAIRFTSSYMEIGESSKEMEVVMGLKKTIEDVYTTGIPTDFDLKDLEETITFYSPPNIGTSVTPVSLDPVPTFLVPGERVSVHRGEYDLGWWKFHFVYVLPETKILFVPLGRSEIVWKTAENITKYFPSTENTKTKVLFGVGCNETEEKQTYLFLNWERDYFADVVLPYLFENGYEFVPCTRIEGYKIITITETPTDADFQVVPITSETGRVYINDTLEGPQEYLYKTPLDVISLLLGGRKFYEYESKRFLEELYMVCDLASREANLLRMKANNPECDILYSKFVQVLGSLKDIIENGDFTNEDDVREFDKKLKKSVEVYEEMEEMGC